MFKHISKEHNALFQLSIMFNVFAPMDEKLLIRQSVVGLKVVYSVNVPFSLVLLTLKPLLVDLYLATENIF